MLKVSRSSLERMVCEIRKDTEALRKGMSPGKAASTLLKAKGRVLALQDLELIGHHEADELIRGLYTAKKEGRINDNHKRDD